MSLTFDPASHTYRVNGDVVRSVTQHLAALHSFAGVPLEVLEAAKERGTYVHDLTVAHDQGDLDEPEVHDQYRPYLAAWKSFVEATVPNWQDIETMGHSELHRYAGTWDRFGLLTWKGSRGLWVLDIKTSEQDHPVWGLQTAAYRQLKAEQDRRLALARRGTVQLRPNGRWKLREWTDPSDWPAFQALLTLNHWVDVKIN